MDSHRNTRKRRPRIQGEGGDVEKAINIIDAEMSMVEEDMRADVLRWEREYVDDLEHSEDCLRQQLTQQKGLHVRVERAYSTIRSLSKKKGFV